MTSDDLRRVHETYRAAVRAHDVAQNHPDRGKRTAAGYAAAGVLEHTADVLRAAEADWEEARLAFLAEREEHAADPH
jgi:hypothetical protein